MQLKKNLQNIHVDNVPPVMVVDNLEDFSNLSLALNGIIHDFLIRHLPLRRIILVASILKQCDVKIPSDKKLIDRILFEQKTDGGWVDCEDTAWALSYLAGLKDVESAFARGLIWLENERTKDYAWGFCKRDNACIPITAQISYFLPHSQSIIKSAYWLEDQWLKDIKAPVSLNYKGAWYLLAYYKLHKSANLSSELFDQTVNYLINEQRDNGPWGPWKGHPAHEECFITGICMAALALSYLISNNKKIVPSLKKSIGWIKQIQMENGLFPTHYIEEGSAWILFGWSKSMMILKDIDQ